MAIFSLRQWMGPWRDTSWSHGHAEDTRGLSRRAVTHERAPALDVDEDLTDDGVARQAAARGRRTWRNPYAAADADTVRFVLAFLHEASDLDHRTFVSFDLRHDLLRPVHAQMHAFGNVDAA